SMDVALPDALEAGLREVGIAEQETLIVELDSLPQALGRAARSGADRVVLSPAPPRAQGAQVVLYVDESGGMSWHMPDAVSRASRNTQPARFTIATRSIASAVALDRQRKSGIPRGPLTKLGRKLFKVLVIPLASAALGDPLATI